jgi:hypothetical protein
LGIQKGFSMTMGGRQGLVAALLLIGPLFVLAGCSASSPSAPLSPRAAVTASPSRLPFAPPATPVPGKPLVGYWKDKLISFLPSYIEVLYGPDGYSVSVNGAPAVAVPTKDGGLDLMPALGQAAKHGTQVFASKLLLRWKGGQAVFWARLGPYDLNSGHQSAGVAIDRATYIKGVDHLADIQTENIYGNDFQVNVRVWADRHGHVPPPASELRPGSRYARWLDRVYEGHYVWPTNPFTGAPIKRGSEPGDFTYTVSGTHWTMRAHLSTGGTYDITYP